VPPQNPHPRIERVAHDLGRLAAEIGDYAGPDAQKALRRWQAELLAAVEDMRRMGADRQSG
jgi:hypothetical protein